MFSEIQEPGYLHVLINQLPIIAVLVPTGSTRTVDFIADNPDDWALHCHMIHRIMNQMGHGPELDRNRPW